jgi:hypothetical protein
VSSFKGQKCYRIPASWANPHQDILLPQLTSLKPTSDIGYLDVWDTLKKGDKLEGNFALVMFPPAFTLSTEKLCGVYSSDHIEDTVQSHVANSLWIWTLDTFQIRLILPINILTLIKYAQAQFWENGSASELFQLLFVFFCCFNQDPQVVAAL